MKLRAFLLQCSTMCISSLPLLVQVGLVSCATSAPSESDSADGPGANPESSGTTQPASVKVGGGAPGESEGPEAVQEVAEATAISATTLRTARGLPVRFQGYPGWFLLPGSAVENSPHLRPSRVHVSFDDLIPHRVGDTVTAPLPPETVVLRESKRPNDDFIRRVDLMVRGESSWTYQTFSRETKTQAFVEEDASECAGCHESAKNDSVHSQLNLGY